MLGVGVHEVEGSVAVESAVLDVADKPAQQRKFEGMKEEGECGLGGKRMERSVSVVKDDGCERVCC